MGKESSEKEKCILANALKLFAAVGYDQTTIDKIAFGARVGKGTVYLYFNNKLHLLLAVLIQGLTRLNQILDHLPVASGNGLERFSSLVTAYFSFIRANSDFFKVFLKEQDRVLTGKVEVDGVSQLVRLKETIRQKFIMEIQQLLQAGMLPDKDPQWYAAVVNGLIIHCALDWVFSEDTVEAAEKGATIVAAFLSEVKVGGNLMNSSMEKERKVWNSGA